MGRRLWIAAKTIAAAGICGIGVGMYFLTRESDTARGFAPDEHWTQKLLMAVAAPVLSAVVAYRSGENKLVITHEFRTRAEQDIALETLRRIV